MEKLFARSQPFLISELHRRLSAVVRHMARLSTIDRSECFYLPIHAILKAES